MTDTAVRDAFERALAGEPPLAVTLDAVVGAGRRVRRRRRVAYGTGVVAVAAAVAAVPLARTRPTAGVAPLRPAASTAATATTATTAPDEGLTARQRAIAAAIRGASPDGWTFDFAAERWDGPQSLDGAVYDGGPASRLMVGVSTATQLLHPCADAEFRQGATCTERVLDDGSVLSLRGLVHAANGVESVEAVLTHPDGSGVNAESSNFVLSFPLPEQVTAEQKHDLVHPDRPHPAYTTDELARVVLAVASAA